MNATNKQVKLIKRLSKVLDYKPVTNLTVSEADKLIKRLISEFEDKESDMLGVTIPNSR